MPYCFSRSSIKFQYYMGDKIDDLNQILSKITRPAAAIKSLSFALFIFRPDQNDYNFANKLFFVSISCMKTFNFIKTFSEGHDCCREWFNAKQVTQQYLKQLSSR